MSSQTTLSFWQLLAVALLPAFIAATVGVLSPLVVEWRKQAAEARKRRTEKLEELIEVLYEHDHWLEIMRDKYTFGSDIRLGPAPIKLAQALVLLHFPSLKKKMADLYMAAQQYEKWIVGAGRKRMANEQNFTDGFDEIYLPYIKTLDEVVSDVVAIGRKEISV